MHLELFGLSSDNFSIDFIKGMVGRIVCGTARYGGWKAAKGKVDNAKSARDRLRQYDMTGNTEFLIDAANFCMGEFMYPSVPGACFTPTADHEESPGLISVHGLRVRHPDDARE